MTFIIDIGYFTALLLLGVGAGTAWSRRQLYPFLIFTGGALGLVAVKSLANG